MIKLSDLIFKFDRPKDYIHNINQKNFNDKFAKWQKIFPKDEVLLNYLSIGYNEHNYNLVIPVVCGFTSNNEYHYSFMIDVFSLESSEYIINYVQNNRKMKFLPAISNDKSVFGQIVNLFSPNRALKFSRHINVFSNRMMCSKKHVVKKFKQYGYILNFK